ncbi:ATP-binding protein [Candidatus Poribacteria bacterium]
MNAITGFLILDKAFYFSTNIDTFMPSPEDLYRKIKPAAPKADQYWKLEQLMEGKERSEWRGLMELQKEKLTGDAVEEKILLDVPSKKISSDGDYPLGMIWHSDNRIFHPFFLKQDEMSSHISVFGLTGSGKTNTVLHLLSTIPHNFIVFDWKRSYRDLASEQDVLVYTVGRKVSPLHFNPLLPPEGVEYESWIKNVIWSLQHSFFLGHGAERILEKTLPGCKNLNEVTAKLDSYKARARELDWLQSTKRSIEALCWGELGRQLNTSGVTIESLMKNKVVIELDALTPSEAIFVTYIIVLGIYSYKQETGDRVYNTVVLEEAHNVLPEARDIKQETPLEKVMRMIREYNTCMVVIDQLPHKLSRAAIANCATNIVLNLKLDEDVQSAGKALLLPMEQRKYLGMLKKGEAIVKSQHRYQSPFLVRIPLVNLTAVSDLQVQKRMSPFLEEMPQSDAKIPAVTSSLDKRELSLLVDVNEQPFDGLQQRYRRLKITGKAGARLVRKTENDGWVKSEFLSLGQRNFKVLSLTHKAKNLLEQDGHEVERFRDGGVEHRYWTHQYYLKMQQEYPDHEVVKEHPVGGGGTVDVAVLPDICAVEIETSSVDRALRNIEKDLEAGFQKIIVVGKSGIVDEAKKHMESEKRLEFDILQ